MRHAKQLIDSCAYRGGQRGERPQEVGVVLPKQSRFRSRFWGVVQFKRAYDIQTAPWASSVAKAAPNGL